MKKLILLLILIAAGSALVKEKKNADLLVYNAKVYTVNDHFDIAQGFAVKDGKILEVGDAALLEDKYNFSQILNLYGRPVYPGFIESHGHFFGLAYQQFDLDLKNTQSFEEVVKKVVEFQEVNQLDYIIGNGWDQTKWKNEEMPTKDTLDILFPETPVVLFRVGGHAKLANSAALRRAEITKQSNPGSGEIVMKDGKMTGLLIDIGLPIPDVPRSILSRGLLDLQEKCFSYGITTINEAGIGKDHLELLDSLQQTGKMKMRFYCMVYAYDENLDYFLNNGIIKNERLNVRSFKYWMDGSLGSRGAALKEEYHDKPGYLGLIDSINDFKEAAVKIANSNFQMNTHAIGDLANFVVLKTYDSLIGDSKDRRWRVEHAQVIDPDDFHYFSRNIIPSVQPTHATSDMNWAKDRLGAEREKGAYAYKKLLDEAGIIALGTDFPVEKVSPFLTFYAAVARKDSDNYPEGGYMPEQALSREETLKGMTIWAAYSNFEEDEKGSIEPGKFADFVILKRDIMEVPINEVPQTKVIATYLGGKKVY